MITHILHLSLFSLPYLPFLKSGPHCSVNRSVKHSPYFANLTITWVCIPDSSIFLAKALFSRTGKAQRADISPVAFTSQVSPRAVGGVSVALVVCSCPLEDSQGLILENRIWLFTKADLFTLSETMQDFSIMESAT